MKRNTEASTSRTVELLRHASIWQAREFTNQRVRKDDDRECKRSKNCTNPKSVYASDMPSRCSSDCATVKRVPVGRTKRVR